MKLSPQKAAEANTRLIFIALTRVSSEPRLAYHDNRNMDDCHRKIMSHVVCPICQEGFLRAVAEVGIEAEGSTVKFQSLSAAQGRIYRCDSCGKEFVKVDNEFLELRYSKNPN
jgi:ribosomal protein L37AE/L43A